jgi:hypothetical protein
VSLAVGTPPAVPAAPCTSASTFCWPTPAARFTSNCSLCGPLCAPPSDPRLSPPGSATTNAPRFCAISPPALRLPTRSWTNSAGKIVDYLRAVLVAIGSLPERDEHMAHLERWTKQALGSRHDPEPDAQALRRYATWHVTRRLRQRSHGTSITFNQYMFARGQIRAAMLFLDWLAGHGLTLATCRQSDLDAWRTDPAVTRHRESGHFLRWATRHKLAALDMATTRWVAPAQALDGEARWQQAHQLLHDTAIDTADRVAGLLLLFYAQWPSAISRLTDDHIESADGHVILRLGPQPIVLPEPLAGLMLQLIRERRRHPVTGAAATTGWLFPGELPGRPISGSQLGERLRRHGIRPSQARSTALFQLATDLPAVILARTLGIQISSATAWQRAASGDWATYAAEVGRRPDRSQPTP